jgi:hypothetical protein
MWKSSPTIPPGLSKKYSAQLISNETMWSEGIDSLGDFYAIPVSSAAIPALTTLIIDTGSAVSHLPMPAGSGSSTADAVNITIGSSNLSITKYQEFDSYGDSVGVLGITALRGYYVVFDLTANAFSLYQ